MARIQKLKRCPFCKQVAKFVSIQAKRQLVTLYAVQCIDCKIKTVYHATKSDAAICWNQRDCAAENILYGIIELIGNKAKTNKLAAAIQKDILSYLKNSE